MSLLTSDVSACEKLRGALVTSVLCLQLGVFAVHLWMLALCVLGA